MTREINDIRITWQNEEGDLLEGDFNFDENAQDLESSTGLQTAVIISLFTDRRANIDDVLPDSNNSDRRGWWGDLTSNFENDQIGSRLWLLERSKTTEDIPVRAKKYAEEALSWLIADAVAVKIEVEAERQGMPGNDILALKVKIYRKSENEQAEEFYFQWTVQEART